MKKILCALAVGSLIFATVACGSNTEESNTKENSLKAVTESEKKEENIAESIKIGFSPYTLTNEYFSAVETGVNEACKELGYEVISADPQSDSTTQAKQIDDMIGQGIKGLVYIPNDSQNDNDFLLNFPLFYPS